MLKMMILAEGSISEINKYEGLMQRLVPLNSYHAKVRKQIPSSAYTEQQN